MSEIILIDDSWIARLKVGGALKKAGYAVREYDSAKEIETIVSSGEPGLVILDLLMPDMDGREALKIVKAKKPDLPVVILSADIQTSTKEECKRLGADGFLNKPIDAETLLASVSGFISG